MGERVVSRVERTRDLAARLVGRKITGVRVRREEADIESIVLILDDGTNLAVDPEVDGDRIMVSLINEG